MTYLARPPSRPLAPFVAHVWYFEDVLPDARERMMPDGQLQLLVNLDDDQLRSYHGERVETLGGAGLSGPHDRWFAIDAREQRCIAGVSFRPGGARPFFRSGVDGFAGLHVDLGDLWGADGRHLRARMLEAPTPHARLDVLERVLLSRACRPLDADRGLDRALAALDRGLPVATVAADAGVTARTLHRAVTSSVGLSPKRFARVRRFQRVLLAVEARGVDDWAGLACEHGYYDQAHLIHDFRDLAGVCPTEYRVRPAGGHNHAVLDPPQ